MRDHGGNIDTARARWGAGDWIDLSTGINRCPYPVPDISSDAWRILPTAAQKSDLLSIASQAYGTNAKGLAVAGAQAAIQMIPSLCKPGLARIIAPTYNEHAAALSFAGWHVEDVSNLNDLSGADLAVVVNPNNPDGRVFSPTDLMSLSKSVGRLVVDESFADAAPELSVLPMAGQDGLLVLRSFGKFWGLAGVRLGFVFAGKCDIEALTQAAGPWPVSGAAIEIGAQALADNVWRTETIARLNLEAQRLDQLAIAAGWKCLGGTALFRLYDTGNAQKAQEQLAQHHIWSRIFPWSKGWVRLGLPGPQTEWSRLVHALGV